MPASRENPSAYPVMSHAAYPYRVLFLTPYYKPYLGGIERAIEKLTTGLRGRAEIAAVGILTSHYAFPRQYMDRLPSMEEMNGGVQIWRVSGNPRKAPPFFSVPLVWFPPGAFRRVMRRFQPDILHWVGDGWFWGHFCSARAAPDTSGIVFTPSFHKLSWERIWLRPLNALLCRRADRVTALSQMEADQVRRAYLVERRKQTMIPWGADASDPDEMRGADRDPRLTVLCVGRLGRHKGQYYLLRVWASASRRFNHPSRLVMVGRDEGGARGKRALLQLVARLGLQDEVVFTGEITDSKLRGWYSRSDLFTLFPHYEAFGLVYFEAMIRGTPVLTHRVGANAELLSRGAVLTDPFDFRTSVDHLVRLINDGNYRRRKGEEARRYARQFSWERVVDRFVRLYREILQSRRSAAQERG